CDEKREAETRERPRTDRRTTGRGTMHSLLLLPHVHKRLDLETANLDLRALALEEDLAAVRFHLRRAMDEAAVEAHLDLIAVAFHFDAVPFPRGSFDFAGARSKPELVLPSRILPEPIDSPPHTNRRRATRRIERRPTFLILLGADLARELERDELALSIATSNQHQIAGRALHDLALDRRAKRAIAIGAVAVGPDGMKENPRVARLSDALAVVSLAPAILEREEVVAKRAPRADVAERLARDAQPAVLETKGPAWIAMLRLPEPGVEPIEGCRLEKRDSLPRSLGDGIAVTVAEETQGRGLGPVAQIEAIIAEGAEDAGIRAPRIPPAIRAPGRFDLGERKLLSIALPPPDEVAPLEPRGGERVALGMIRIEEDGIACDLIAVRRLRHHAIPPGRSHAPIRLRVTGLVAV